jgi:hypothetical protein
VRSDGLGAPSSLSLTITGTSPVPGGEIAPSSRTREPEFPSHWPTMGLAIPRSMLAGGINRVSRA